MGVLDRYDTEQTLSIGAGGGLGILGFALWMGLEPSGFWGVVGLGALFVGGVVSGAGSVGFGKGVRTAVGAMGLILVGETVVMTGIVAARPGNSGLEAIAVGVGVTVVLFWLVGSLVFAPFLLLGGLGGWIREKVSGPIEEGPAVGPGGRGEGADGAAADYWEDDGGDGGGDTGSGDWHRPDER